MLSTLGLLTFGLLNWYLWRPHITLETKAADSVHCALDIQRGVALVMCGKGIERFGCGFGAGALDPPRGAFLRLLVVFGDKVSAIWYDESSRVD